MTRRHLLLLLSSISLMQTVYATSIDSPKNQGVDNCGQSCLHSHFLALEAGITGFNQHQQMRVANGSALPPPFDSDTFTTHQDNGYKIAISAGREWKLNNKVVDKLDLALRAQHIDKQDISGSIMQYTLPQFNNYDYSWSLQSNTLMVVAKMLAHPIMGLHPYLTAGAGIALNRSNNYRETAKAGVTARLSPAFQRNTTEQFTYSLGAGINCFATQDTRIGLGYEFQNFGRVISGKGTAGWVGETLTLSKLQSHSVMISVEKMFS